MEIKNKLTVTRGEGERTTGGKGEGASRNIYKGPMDKAKRVGGAGRWRGG